LDFSRGANFAIVGGTALDVGFFLRRSAASVPPFRSSLRVQIGWFRRLKRSLCNTTTAAAAAGCKDRLMARSLFVVGELGSNDYGYILAGGKSLPEAKSFVPEVVKAICRGIEESNFFVCDRSSSPIKLLPKTEELRCTSHSELDLCDSARAWSQRRVEEGARYMVVSGTLPAGCACRWR